MHAQVQQQVGLATTKSLSHRLQAQMESTRGYQARTQTKLLGNGPFFCNAAFNLMLLFHQRCKHAEATLVCITPRRPRDEVTPRRSLSAHRRCTSVHPT